MRERRFPTPSGADYEKADATKNHWALWTDRLSTIVGVFCFALMAVIQFNTHPIMAAACLTIAILCPAFFAFIGSLRRRFPL